MARFFAKDPFTLIAFHRVLISSAVLACIGFAAWELFRNMDRGGASAVIGAVISLGLAVGMVFYLIKIRGRR